MVRQKAAVVEGVIRTLARLILLADLSMNDRAERLGRVAGLLVGGRVAV
jgi:hypothetical protein